MQDISLVLKTAINDLMIEQNPVLSFKLTYTTSSMLSIKPCSSLLRDLVLKLNLCVSRYLYISLQALNRCRDVGCTSMYWYML